MENRGLENDAQTTDRFAFTLIRVLPINPNETQLLQLSHWASVKMKTCSADFILVTFIYSLLLLLKCEANMVSKQFQAEVYDTMNNNASICHDGFMSVYISKVQFADLPFSIYVQGKIDTINISYQCWCAVRWLYLFCSRLCPHTDTDEHGRYYQAVALAKQCHYFFGESDTLIILTVSANGCFVSRQVS